MELGNKHIIMEIFMMEILSMDFHKGMVSINGKINQCIRVISSKDIEMVMEYGNHLINDKNTLVIFY